MVVDQKFLDSVRAVIMSPGNEDIAVEYMAEIAPGLIVAREVDGECIVYVNLETYKSDIVNLRERDAMPDGIGVFQNMMIHLTDIIIRLAREALFKKDGSPPDWYEQPILISDATRGIQAD